MWTIKPKDVINKGFINTNISRTDGHISLLDKDYGEFKLLSNKQFEEKAFETTIQILHDIGLIDQHKNADENIDYPFTESRGPDFQELNDDAIQSFYSLIQFKKESNIKQKNSTTPFISDFDWYEDKFERWTIYIWCRYC